MENNSRGPRRVKLYTLSQEKWVDCGTGYCSGIFNPQPHFLVINENDNNDILLKEAIKGSIQFQRQQDTLIVWTSYNDVDYALSFQEPEGCQELCDFLIMIQKTIENNISLIAIYQDDNNNEKTELIVGPLPDIPMPNFDNIFKLLDNLSSINQFKNKIISILISDDFKWFKELIRLFDYCETNHELNHLHCLNDILKTLIYFNEMNLFEILLNEDLIDGVIGILEYEPDYPQFKMNFRSIFKNQIRIHQILELNDNSIKEEVRRSCILQFLKDVVLIRILDDNGLNCISTMIQLKENNLIEFIKSDKMFLSNLFNMYDVNNYKNVDLKKLRDGIKMLHQFVKIVKRGQNFQRMDFYKSLLNHGLMKMIEFSLSTDSDFIENKILTTEIIVTIVEQDVNLFKINNKGTDANINKFQFDSLLLNMLMNVLINDSNIGLKTQAFEALKIIIDPSNMIEYSNSPSFDSDLSIENYDDEDENDDDNDDDIINDNESSNNNNNNISNENFYLGFYGDVALKLFSPLSEIDRIDQFSKDLIISYSNLCELVGFVSKFHERAYSRSFILENHLLIGVSKLLSSKINSFHLRLSALRCLKLIITLNDEFYTRYIIENDLLKEFIGLLEECSSDNLINSSCLNLLCELIDNDDGYNFKLIRNYLCNNYTTQLKNCYIGEKLIQLKEFNDEIDEKNMEDRNSDVSDDEIDADDENDDEVDDDIKTDFDINDDEISDNNSSAAEYSDEKQNENNENLKRSIEQTLEAKMNEKKCKLNT